MSSPYRILTVCTGNICRSPMAEFMLKNALAAAGLGDDVVVDSAGTMHWQIGDPIDPRAGAVLVEHSIDSSAHRARQFDAAWFPDRELILALDAGHYYQLRALAPDAAARSKVRMLRSFDPAAAALAPDEQGIEDPYYGGPAGFNTSWEQITAALTGIIETVRKGVDARV